jgi:hypothetical protein
MGGGQIHARQRHVDRVFLPTIAHFRSWDERAMTGVETIGGECLMPFFREGGVDSIDSSHPYLPD